jgi:coproporphyrinogen III oxidase-like Fe-S oxidoreductase
VVNKLSQQGLLTLSSDRLKLTDRGRDLSNSVFIEFME